MANKTVNQIWKDYVEKKGISFKEWLGVEKHYYTKRNPSIDFDNWVNKRYIIVKDEFLNFDWNKVKDWINDNKDAIGTGLGAVAGNETNIGDENSNDDKSGENPPPTDNKIFGMPKVLAIGVGVVALAGITFGIVKIVKSVKK